MQKKKFGIAFAIATVMFVCLVFFIMPGESNALRNVLKHESAASEAQSGTAADKQENSVALAADISAEEKPALDEALPAELNTAARVEENVSRSGSSNVLKPGAAGDQVTELQNRLKALGFYNFDITGYYGEITAVAVSNLQEKYGLFPDGTVGNDTLALINKLAGGQTVEAAKQQQAAAPQAPALLKVGARGSEVDQLQRNLKKLGYFTLEATGYYGDATAEAVRRMQAQHGAVQDGVAGESTLALVQKLLSQGYTAPVQSQVTYAPKVGGSSGDYLVSWFGGAENIFSIGSVATIYDIDSGLSFRAKRTYGYNHADCEPLTYNDTQIMKRIYGGQWSWTRHAIIVEVNGRRMAASMAGMPHAGNDAAPANSYVTWRSGDYGAGTNLDTVKGNGTDGHFDVHFLGSRTHGTNSVDSAHQAQVKRAASWAAAN